MDSRIRKRRTDAKNKRRELAARAARGEQQATLFFKQTDLAFLDAYKESRGAASRSEAMAMLIEEHRRREAAASHHTPPTIDQESKVPSG